MYKAHTVTQIHTYIHAAIIEAAAKSATSSFCLRKDVFHIVNVLDTPLYKSKIKKR